MHLANQCFLVILEDLKLRIQLRGTPIYLGFARDRLPQLPSQLLKPLSGLSQLVSRRSSTLSGLASIHSSFNEIWKDHHLPRQGRGPLSLACRSNVLKT